MRILSTREVGKLLAVPPSRLSRIVWDGRIPEPERGPGNSFLWNDEDVNRASKVLLGRPYRPQTPKKVTILSVTEAVHV